MLFYYLCILVGFVLIIYGFYKLFQLIYPASRYRMAGKNWPETTGTVTKSGVDFFSRPRSKKYYWVRVRYSYQVEGIEHTGRFNIETLPATKAKAIQNLEKFPPGIEIYLRYNPQKPAECFTKYDRLSFYKLMDILWMPVCGVLLIVAGASRF